MLRLLLFVGFVGYDMYLTYLAAPNNVIIIITFMVGGSLIVGETFICVGRTIARPDTAAFVCQLISLRQSGTFQIDGHRRGNSRCHGERMVREMFVIRGKISLLTISTTRHVKRCLSGFEYAESPESEFQVFSFFLNDPVSREETNIQRMFFSLILEFFGTKSLFKFRFRTLF